jgi:predicted dehydrogenase
MGETDRLSLGVGVVGCGRISETYVRTLAGSDAVRLVQCADLDPARARRIAAVAGAEATTTAELLVDERVQVVLNLTPPAMHAEIALAGLEAGKHVYGEKPLATDRAAARQIIEQAAARGLAVGCAPDTFLGPSWQQARTLVDAGAIGEPVAVRATMLAPGPESWHPDPAFFYQRGGGPLLDMGPYYVSAIVSLLGPVARVSASARRTHEVRPVTGGPRVGDMLHVEVATHVAALLELESGAIATLVTSFDCWDQVHSIELWGTDGTLLLPDPNGHNGTIQRRGRDTQAPWETLDGAPDVYARGIGLVEMAEALGHGAAPRAGGELAFHVLDVLLSILESAEADAAVEVGSSCQRPAPLAPEQLAA